MRIFQQWFSSLQTRVVVLTVCVATVLWLFAAFLAWSATSHEVDELLDAHLAQSAALLISQQATHGTSNNETSDELPLLHKYASKVAFQVYQNNTIVWHSSQLEHEMFDKTKIGFFEIEAKDGHTWRVFSAKDEKHHIQVFVAELNDERYGIVDDVLESLSLPLMSVIGALSIIVFITTRAALSPLRQLRKLLIQRNPSNMEELVLLDSPTEIAPIVKALNSLFIKINDLLEQQKRFNADAAHELRTPIAAIRMQAQVAMQAYQQQNSEQEIHALKSTLNGCDRATRLVDQLLTLSKLDAQENQRHTIKNSPNQATENATTDLAQVCQNMSLDLATLALLRSQDLELIAPEHAMVNGSPTLWEILFRNLLDNAIRYSPHGAKIRIEIKVSDKFFLLTIDDSGPGMPAQEMKKLGERFYRQLGTDTAGSGLGWSIVRRVVGVLEVNLDVKTSTLLGGLKVEILVPQLPPPVSSTININ